MKRGRIEELDFLRGLAFIAVVYQHVIGQYIRRPDLAYEDVVMLGLIFNLLKFAVPLFVFITGLTLVYNYFEKVNYLTFMKKRIKDIYLPFLIWTVIYFLYTHQEQFDEASLSWIKEIGIQTVLPQYGYHLWYIVMIFQFYLLYPLLLAGVKWVYKNVPVAASLGMMAILYAWLMWLSQRYFPAHVNGYPDWLQVLVQYRTSNFLFYFFYFFLGAIAALYLNQWKSWVGRAISWNFFLFIGLYLWVSYELLTGPGESINLGYSTSLKVSMFIFTISNLLLLYGLAIRLAEWKTSVYRIFSFIGKYSFGAYLAHALILGLLLRNIPWANHFVVMLLTTALSVLFTYLLVKVPGGGYVVGMVGRKKKAVKGEVPRELAG